MRTIFLACAVALLALAGPARAQQQLEIIKLNYSTVDQVPPQFKSFVEPGGTLYSILSPLDRFDLAS